MHVYLKAISDKELKEIFHTRKTLGRKLSVKYKERPVIWAGSCGDLAQRWLGLECFSAFLVISHYTKHGTLRGQRKDLLHRLWETNVTFLQLFFTE